MVVKALVTRAIAAEPKTASDQNAVGVRTARQTSHTQASTIISVRRRNRMVLSNRSHNSFQHDRRGAQQDNYADDVPVYETRMPSRRPLPLLFNGFRR